LIYAFLADYRNHRLLAGRRIGLLELSGGTETMHGLMLLRGPLLIRRRVRTHLSEACQPDLLMGRARVGRCTRAVVRWDLEAQECRCTRVSLTAEVLAAGRLDRLILKLGGRRWIQTLFVQSIERLSSLVAVNTSRACTEPHRRASTMAVPRLG
jgi:hypothetical protein